MEEILDSVDREQDELKYLKKSARLYKINGALFVFMLIMSVFVKPLLLKNSSYGPMVDLFDLIIGGPFLIIFILSPFGLFYSWKSYKSKEGLSKSRWKYTLGHLFFCLLILLFLIVFITDLSQLI